VSSSQEGELLGARRLSERARKCYALRVRALVLAVFFLALPTTVWGGNAGSSATKSSPIQAISKQLLLVRTASWWATAGTLQRYERDEGLRWRLVGGAVPVNVGRAGMGWGRGLHPEGGVGPQKREGDGRSPAGVFRLTQAFGIAEALPPGSAGLAYAKSLPSSYCVEDTRSALYNQIVDSTHVTVPSWQQWSAMRRPDGLFDWGIVVEQNAPVIKKAAGSCVFLHIWRGLHRPTSGCTSMPQHELEEILRWLDAARAPLLAQLPELTFQAVREAWGLPSEPR
jgi:L,D-peptidoglycan transpeptidase YkuD (ErfK/YbiS/YcfS/YnhG family)